MILYYLKIILYVPSVDDTVSTSMYQSVSLVDDIFLTEYHTVSSVGEIVCRSYCISCGCQDTGGSGWERVLYYLKIVLYLLRMAKYRW
jgi:hypothetical protein